MNSPVEVTGARLGLLSRSFGMQQSNWYHNFCSCGWRSSCSSPLDSEKKHLELPHQLTKAIPSTSRIRPRMCILRNRVQQFTLPADRGSSHAKWVLSCLVVHSPTTLSLSSAGLYTHALAVGRTNFSQCAFKGEKCYFPHAQWGAAGVALLTVSYCTPHIIASFIISYFCIATWILTFFSN